MLVVGVEIEIITLIVNYIPKKKEERLQMPIDMNG